MKYLIISIMAGLLTACSFYTEITYRAVKSDEYIRDDGFIISCERDGNQFVVGTYTPESWGESFYYGYLDGSKTDKKLKIKAVELLFVETGETLTLQEIRKEREYIYTSERLNQIINANKTLKLKVYITDEATGNMEAKTFLLTRKKHTYPTGTFPH